MVLKKLKMSKDNILKRIQSLKRKKGKIAVIEPDSGEYIYRRNINRRIEKS